MDFSTKMKQLQADMSDLLQQEASKQQLKNLFEKLGLKLQEK
jgi:type I restriction enzyme M protein